ncbi:hypothetical protein CSW14_07240 [Thermus scotoductus]|uniref:Prepilin-type cleavage/methylation domain-containing protein n=1 Tax=Thermus scotoductus TaxID=37636 RepID=A0A430VNQ4_THESC|nr:prepilin-type N-terminal cleavage/methylation domain-containing protein [Thermus scotoductus]RTI54481.1 hypothetical protein CSW14_07240 [Thermus scotoductus]
MDRKGFTLLELLLAVAILGVLLGLLLWYLEPLRQRANLAAGLGYARSVATSLGHASAYLEALRDPRNGAPPTSLKVRFA